MKLSNILILCTIAFCAFLAMEATLQQPTVEMTSDSLGSKLVSTDAMGGKLRVPRMLCRGMLLLVVVTKELL